MGQRLPLDGVVVADFSRVLAGPYATTMLADLGASVIKVERPGAGDDTRRWGPPWTDNSAAYFESVNRGKRSVTLDLATADGQHAAAELVRRADVLVENFRPGALAQYGLDYESASALNPALVYASISGFGSDEGADLPGYDFVVQAVGGLMSITGAEGGPPTKAGVAVVDVLTGKDATLGIMAALRQRESTGEGQHVEVNLLSSLLGSLVNQMGSMLATGQAPSRKGNAHPSIAPYETLRCEDGYLAVAVGNDAQFAKLAEVLGMAGVATDPRFSTNAQRVANRSALTEALENVLGARPAADWQVRIAQAGIACGQVNDIKDAIRYAESLGLRPIVELDGAMAQPRMPIDFSGFDSAEILAPPRLGEHTDEVLTWLAAADGTRLAPRPASGRDGSPLAQYDNPASGGPR